jgi:hypothetical protein
MLGWNCRAYRDWLREYNIKNSDKAVLVWLITEHMLKLINQTEDQIMVNYFEAMLSKLDELGDSIDNGTVDETKLRQHLQVTDRRIKTLVALNVSRQTYNKQIELAMKAQSILGVNGKEYMPAIEHQPKD